MSSGDNTSVGTQHTAMHQHHVVVGLVYWLGMCAQRFQLPQDRNRRCLFERRAARLHPAHGVPAGHVCVPNKFGCHTTAAGSVACLTQEQQTVRKVDQPSTNKNNNSICRSQSHRGIFRLTARACLAARPATAALWSHSSSLSELSPAPPSSLDDSRNSGDRWQQQRRRQRQPY